MPLTINRDHFDQGASVSDYFTPSETVFVDSEGKTYDPAKGGLRDGHKLAAGSPIPKAEARALGLLDEPKAKGKGKGKSRDEGRLADPSVTVVTDGSVPESEDVLVERG